MDELINDKNYTVEIYKADRRVKGGRRFVRKVDLTPVSEEYAQLVAEQQRRLGFDVDLYETYVTKKNLMTGEEYQERYDTPWSCSPSTESYWSM